VTLGADMRTLATAGHGEAHLGHATQRDEARRMRQRWLLRTDVAAAKTTALALAVVVGSNPAVRHGGAYG
jgi:hypothetical protein